MEELAALDWQRDGACRDEDSALFFGPVQIEENPRERILRVRAAKRICAQCPVLERCRGYALEHEEEYGVWGGMSARERGMLVKARHRRV